MQNSPAPFKHRCFLPSARRTPGMPEQPDPGWILDTWSRGDNDASAIPSSTAWNSALQECRLVNLVLEPKSSSSHLFPGDTGHTEHYTFSAASCWAVSPCTVTQLPWLTSWRHQLFRVFSVLTPTSDCTCKKPDELIMEQGNSVIMINFRTKVQSEPI